MRITIVGGNAAGLNAASAARKVDREAEFVVIESEDKPAYSRCGLPHVISGEISSFEDLVVYPPSYYKMMRIDLRLKTTAKWINVEEKALGIEYDGEEEALEYDRLILATGSRSFMPSIKGRELEGVYPLRTMLDGRRIMEAAAKSSSVVVIGGGLVGLEAAVALKQIGLRVTLVEMFPQLAPNMLDPDMAQILQKRLEEAGINIFTGSKVEEIEGTDRVSDVKFSGGEAEADFVVAAMGVHPNTELARGAGIRIGETGAIWVNNRMETSVNGVYAAGECAEAVNFITLRPTLSQLGTTAVRGGKVAGINAAGGYSTFPGVLNSSVTKLFDVEVGSTGLTEKLAELQGLETISGKVLGKTRATYYPGAKELAAKLVFDKETMKLIGAQVLGGEATAPRINTLSMAIRGGMTLWDLEKAENCYTPPLAETWEPSLHGASEAVLVKLRRGRRI
ncbi:MAG: FAD-dependent oxidoreductase [Candidatus Bathyarchaeia archaeon]